MPNEKPAPVLGKEYSYYSVASFYRPEVVSVHFVLVRGSRVLALRLREDYNPRIIREPAEVWVGAKNPVRSWGDRLASDTTRVPVFVKRRGRTKYTFFGDYEVLHRAATADELAQARARVPHRQGVSRIVFLKRL